MILNHLGVALRRSIADGRTDRQV